MENDEYFANKLADKTFHGMTRCERYGMTWGCRIECPVLQSHECELKDSNNKELYQEYLTVSRLNNSK